MSIDKFGRFKHKNTRIIPIRQKNPNYGFKLTPDGDFDMENKRIRNVLEPIESNDAINKKYLDGYVRKETDDNYFKILSKFNPDIQYLKTNYNQMSSRITAVNNKLFNRMEKMNDTKTGEIREIEIFLKKQLESHKENLENIENVKLISLEKSLKNELQTKKKDIEQVFNKMNNVEKDIIAQFKKLKETIDGIENVKPVLIKIVKENYEDLKRDIEKFNENLLETKYTSPMLDKLHNISKSCIDSTTQNSNEINRLVQRVTFLESNMLGSTSSIKPSTADSRSTSPTSSPPIKRKLPAPKLKCPEGTIRDRNDQCRPALD